MSNNPNTKKLFVVIKSNPKPKRTRKNIRAAIQALYANGWSKLSIAKELKVNYNTVTTWVNRGNCITFRKPKRLKVSAEQLDWIKSMAANKETIKDSASSTQLAKSFHAQFGLKICQKTMNNYLNKLLARPRKLRKVFYMSEENRSNRLKFIEDIMSKGIKGKDIFFTDEKKFLFRRTQNSSTNRIRLTKENDIKLKQGDPEMLKLVSNEIGKFEQGFMVSGGISYYGVSKLVFCVGNVNSFSYKQCLMHYARDLKRLGNNLYLQQDGASAHKSYDSMKFIKQVFKKRLEYWPPNSPDLSPIELVWSIMEHELSKKRYRTIGEKKKELIRLWNSIPIELCRKLIDTFDYRCKWVSEHNGAPYNQREKRRKVQPNEPYIWKPWNPSLDIECVQYNDTSLKCLKEKRIDFLAKKRKALIVDYEKKGNGKHYTQKELNTRIKNWGNGARFKQYEKDGLELRAEFMKEYIDAIDNEVEELKDPSYNGLFIAKLSKEQRDAATLLNPSYVNDEKFGDASTNVDEGVIIEGEGIELHNRLSSINSKDSLTEKMKNIQLFLDTSKKLKKKFK